MGYCYWDVHTLPNWTLQTTYLCWCKLLSCDLTSPHSHVYLQLQITQNKLVSASEDHTVCIWYYKKKKYMSKVFISSSIIIWIEHIITCTG